MTEALHQFLSSIKVVAFDVDQTLVDEAPSLRRRWEETLEEFSHLSDKLAGTFFSIFDARGPGYKKHLNDALQTLNLHDDHIQPIVSLFRSTKSREEHLYEGVTDVLVLLKQKGFRIGVITDGLKDYQEHRLKVAGLYDLFDFFYYGDAHQKPDPAFFRRCIENEKIGPHELLYVGDHLGKDVEGALAAGARACWIAGSDASFPPPGVISFKTMYTFYQWLREI